MENCVLKIVAGVLGIVLLFTVGYSISPSIRELVNGVKYDVQKADDRTNYETLKKVEDTCRAMIASYEADKLTYEQIRKKPNGQSKPKCGRIRQPQVITITF